MGRTKAQTPTPVQQIANGLAAAISPPKVRTRKAKVQKKQDFVIPIIIRHEPDEEGADYEVSDEPTGVCPDDINQDELMDYLMQCLDNFFGNESPE